MPVPIILQGRPPPRYRGTALYRLPVYTNIYELFQQCVVELVFTRRTKLPNPRKRGHMRLQRRMICTANWRMVSSTVTTGLYKWIKPQNNPKGFSWYRSRNLLIVWDLIHLDWRIISLDHWRVIAYYPVNALAEKVVFTRFFKQRIVPMSEQERMSLNDRVD